MQPEIKAAAVRAVELASDSTQRVQVVYPQYGGLLASSASVIVIAQRVPTTGHGQSGPSTVVEVRLRRRRGRWAVTELLPSPGAGSTGVGPDARTAALLANPRVDLPGPAMEDLASGAIAPAVVNILDHLSDEFGMSVSVLRSGHPRFVYGTTTLSNHARGRAVDVWAIDGIPVAGMDVDDPRLLRFLSLARTLGSDEIGAPVDPDGPGGAHFADDLHRDHVHIGFDPY